MKVQWDVQVLFPFSGRKTKSAQADVSHLWERKISFSKAQNKCAKTFCKMFSWWRFLVRESDPTLSYCMACLYEYWHFVFCICIYFSFLPSVIRRAIWDGKSQQWLLMSWFNVSCFYSVILSSLCHLFFLHLAFILVFSLCVFWLPCQVIVSPFGLCFNYVPCYVLQFCISYPVHRSVLCSGLGLFRLFGFILDFCLNSSATFCYYLFANLVHEFLKLTLLTYLRVCIWVHLLERNFDNLH